MDKKILIIEAAIKLFNKYGVQDTPTSKIVKEAGVATGTLFNYFNTKEQLIHQLYKYCKTSLISTLHKDIPEGISFKEMIKVFVFNAIEWSKTNPDKFRYYQFYCHSNFKRNENEESEDVFIFFNQIIEMGQNAGLFKKMPIEILSTIVIGTVIKIMEFNIYKNSNELNIEDCFSIVWDILKK